MDEISPKLPQLVKPGEPIKSRESKNAKRKNTSGVLTIHETVQTIDARKEVAKTPIKETMTDFKDVSNRISVTITSKQMQKTIGYFKKLFN